MENVGHGSADRAPHGVNATVQALSFPPGLYLFRVRSAAPVRVAEAHDIMLPALQVALAPGSSPERVAFMPGPNTSGTWLYDAGDMLVARVADAPATLLLTSFRVSPTPALDVAIDRLDGGTRPIAAHASTPGQAGLESLLEPPRIVEEPVTLRIVTHLRGVGDVSFADAEWAGRPGDDGWIEAFAITPVAVEDAITLEYKGLLANGIETPWVAQGAMCGTRGVGMPLIGFAVRVRPLAAARSGRCEYSGSFRSAATVGPLRSGELCRSNAAGDPLTAIRVRVLAARSPASAETRAAMAKAAQQTEARKIPSDATASLQSPSPAREAMPPSALRLRIDAHIANRGDVSFVDVARAGCLGHGMSIEAFSVTPLDVEPPPLECKGLTASGFETMWVGNGESCGTRGMGVPLIGFAIRARPESGIAGYDCVYRGFFRSGSIDGPRSNGAPCRSPLDNDPLEGIELCIERRQAHAAPTAFQPQAQAPARVPGAVGPAVGPRFSRFREDEEPAPALADEPVAALAAAAEPAAAKPQRTRKRNGKAGAAAKKPA
jgi:hypothetical protein